MLLFIKYFMSKLYMQCSPQSTVVWATFFCETKEKSLVSLPYPSEFGFSIFSSITKFRFVYLYSLMTFYVCVCIYLFSICVKVSEEAKRGVQVPWTWTCKWLWIAWSNVTADVPFVNLVQIRVIWEEGLAVEDLPPSDCPVACLWALSWLVMMLGAHNHCAIPAQMGLGYIRKQAGEINQ